MPMPEDETISQVAGFRSGLHEELMGQGHEDTGSGRPVESEPVPEDARGRSEDLEDEALSGAQISSLKDIVLSVSRGELSPESAIELVIVAYPSVPRERAERMIGSAAGVSVESGNGQTQTGEESFDAYFKRLRTGNGHTPSTGH